MAKQFDLLYGLPGTGKSLALIKLIKAEHAATGKIARVYVGDGSKIMYTSSGLVDAGIVDIIDFAIRDEPFTTCQNITEGMVPVDPEDPRSKMRKLTVDEVQKTGIWVFEGAAVMGNYMLGDAKGGLAYRAAQGEVIGQDAPIRFTDKESGNSFGGNAGAHYNVGQRYILANILRSKQFPGKVFWTTHERMDDGERGGSFAKGQTAAKVTLGEKLIGPEIVGKALTSSISRDFGNTLHFQIATKKVAKGTDPVSGKTNFEDKTDYRIYTRDHYDPDGIVALKYMGIVRTTNPSKIKDFYADEDNPGNALINLYNDLESANKLV